MRAVIVLFILLAIGGLGTHGCSRAVGGSSAAATERVIQAEPGEIVEAMRASLIAEGMEAVSRADSGDYYRATLSGAELRSNPQYARLADQGDLVFNARVNRQGIEFTATFESGLVSGFNIEMSPAPGGATNARVAPILRPSGRAQDERYADMLQRNFSRFGERVLESVADAAERDSGKRS
jgi:hypothetical protein